MICRDGPSITLPSSIQFCVGCLPCACLGYLGYKDAQTSATHAECTGETDKEGDEKVLEAMGTQNLSWRVKGDFQEDRTCKLSLEE